MPCISGAASHLPDRVVENKDLVQFPPEVRELIASRAGVRTRRHVTTECTSDLGACAVKRLLGEGRIAPSSVGAVICATSSPDRMQPATATRIQELCGLRGAFAFDVNSVCSGAVYGLRLASALVKDGVDRVIVVAAEAYSKILNPEDISTFPYFGDGAAAVLVEASGRYELCDFLLHSDGSGADVIQVPAGGTMLPGHAVTKESDRYFTMLGRAVFDFACLRGSELVLQLAERNGVTPDVVVPHQANANIIAEIASRSGVPIERFSMNLDRYGNTAAASVLIAFDELWHGRSPARHVFLIAFGGGLSWGGAYLRAA